MKRPVARDGKLSGWRAASHAPCRMQAAGPNLLRNKNVEERVTATRFRLQAREGAVLWR